jgi:GH15 family glucan-1,4-alpha-glucosidase
MADLVTELWRRPDSGIWEVRSEPQHFTQSKMMCWIALDRAVKLAERGSIPDDRAPHWRAEANELRAFVDTRCWSEDKQSYVRFAGGEELDASLLLGVLFGWGDPRGRRLSGTVEAVRRELGHGPYVHRYSGEDGLSGSEGAFLSCSFWLAEALAHAGRLEEATSLLDELVALANDVGLYAEEVEPASGDFLGNMPQGLSHLALIGAATAIEAEARR